MKIILSRKGFDSGYGKIASPILPDGTLLSMPIPTTDKTFEGSCRLTKLNNEDYVKGEGSIYNKVVLPSIESHKYAKTSDTTDFSDEASLLVKKDEEFSYRVSVQNTSQAKAENVVVVDEVPAGLTVV